MSDPDQAVATLALADEDVPFAWYRPPDIGEQASFRLQAGRGALGQSELCGECASLAQAMLGARPGSSTSHDEQGDIGGGFDTSKLFIPLKGYTFQKPYSQLRDDANFCALCRAIEDSVAISQRYAAPYHPTPISPGSHLMLRSVSRSSDQYFTEDVDGFLVAVAGDKNIREEGYVDIEGRKGFLEVEVRETEPVRAADNLSSSDAAKGRENVTIQGISFRNALYCRDMKQILHSWLQECDSVHDKCLENKNAAQGSKDGDSPAPPSRLLEIQQVDGRYNIRLVAGSENRARYVALSHRWGNYESIQTTTWNIDSYQNGINFDSLSVTLQQAVQITHAAGVRHLWIDCLCIIQDNPSDWASEAPKMLSVYAGAYFTIAASAYEDKGCFPVKFSEDHRVAIDAHPGLELNIYPRSSSLTYHIVVHEPLQKRGWTLQERLLSQRILYCSRYEYYWLCREQSLRACGGPDRWLNFWGAPALLSNSAQSQRDALTQWCLLLEDYSGRQLTLKKDKLVAISGLADIFKRWIGPRYLHGLWECDLARGLAWHSLVYWRPKSSGSESGSESGREVKSFESEKSQFWCTRSTRPPSWSWASVDGPQSHNEVYLPELARNLRQPLSELVHVKATVASDDEHRYYLGDESSAESELLRISGRLSKPFYGHENADEQRNRAWQINSEGRARAFELYADDPGFHTDEQDADAESSRLYVLPIVANMGLVITPAGDDGVPLYRRLGACRFHLLSLSEYNPDREQSEDSTPGTADSGTEHVTFQTDDRVTQALDSENETDTEAFDEGADAASYTEGESSSTEDLTKSESKADHGPGLDPYWEAQARGIRWLRKAGASETIFLC